MDESLKTLKEVTNFVPLHGIESNPKSETDLEDKRVKKSWYALRKTPFTDSETL